MQGLLRKHPVHSFSFLSTTTLGVAERCVNGYQARLTPSPRHWNKTATRCCNLRRILIDPWKVTLNVNVCSTMYDVRDWTSRLHIPLHHGFPPEIPNLSRMNVFPARCHPIEKQIRSLRVRRSREKGPPANRVVDVCGRERRFAIIVLYMSLRRRTFCRPR
jgi:hypothetical protein